MGQAPSVPDRDRFVFYKGRLLMEVSLLLLSVDPDRPQLRRLEALLQPTATLDELDRALDDVAYGDFLDDYKRRAALIRGTPYDPSVLAVCQAIVDA